MITLVLVRHAKSDWGDASVADHERPLNTRGMRDAPFMAARLAATGLRPDVLMSSTAVRARTTAEAFGAALGVAVDLRDELYNAASGALWRAAASTGARAVVVTAHNPGISDLASRLSDGALGPLPTCAVATFRWGTDDWDVAATTPPANFDLDTPGR